MNREDFLKLFFNKDFSMLFCNKDFSHATMGMVLFDVVSVNFSGRASVLPCLLGF